jgi:hypothetical protein
MNKGLLLALCALCLCHQAAGFIRVFGWAWLFPWAHRLLLCYPAGNLGGQQLGNSPASVNSKTASETFPQIRQDEFCG